jgi:hypothetical protein
MQQQWGRPDDSGRPHRRLEGQCFIDVFAFFSARQTERRLHAITLNQKTLPTRKRALDGPRRRIALAPGYHLVETFIHTGDWKLKLALMGVVPSAWS